MRFNILLLVIVVTSCTKTVSDYPPEYHNIDHEASEFKRVEIGFTFNDENQEFIAEFIDSLVIIEGDIIIGKAEDFLDQGLAVVIANGKLWEKGIIPYVIEYNHPKKKLIKEAIMEINSKTNLNLLKRTREKDYVFFANSSGCSSKVGRFGQKQVINIGKCSRGNIMHEILHTAGFYHEQSRSDRDDYVIINWDNIYSKRKGYFKKYIDVGLNGKDIGPYDYSSIMHYSDKSFSKNNKKTIELKITSSATGTIIGQRDSLSVSDVISINLTYSKPQSN